MKHANIAIFVPHSGCPHQCSFCDQRSITGQLSQPTPQDVTAAASQAARDLGERSREAEIAFFGGSFTAIPRAQMESLLQAAAPFVREGVFSGIRCSTRPDAVDREVLSLLKSYGVTAVELGAQSADDRVLALNRRGHTAQDIRQASRLIRQAGLSLGLQMMTGLFGSSPESDLATARELADLHPDTMRIYPTVVLRGTLLSQWYEQGRYRPPTLEEAVDLCARLLVWFEQRQIPVIRLGLHDSESLQSQRIAGPYHPAFRELCESRLFRQLLQQALPVGAEKALMIRVHPRSISPCVGQKRSNRLWLEQQGFRVKICPDDTLGRYEVRISGLSEEKKNR